jgi:hypothetical protein
MCRKHCSIFALLLLVEMTACAPKAVPWPTASAVLITETPQTAQSPTPTSPSLPAEFPVNYPIEISHAYSAEISGMDIPVSIGVTQGLADRPSEPITDIQIAPDVVPLVADYFLKMCYYRYTQVEGHTDVNSFDQYKQLVADGGGQVQLAAYDGTDKDSKLTLRTVDPSKGFSLVFADEALPIRMSNLESIYLGVDKDGRLLIGDNLSSRLVSAFKSDANIELEVRQGLNAVIRNGFIGVLSDLGGAENRCMLTGDYLKACGGNYNPPKTILDWGGLFSLSLPYSDKIEKQPFLVSQE